MSPSACSPSADSGWPADTNPMNILLTIHAHMDPNSGAPGITWQLGHSYEAEGHEVSYLSYDDMPTRVPRRLVPVFFPQLMAWRVRSLMARGRLDVIDASSGDAWFWATRFRKKGAANPLLATRSHGLEHAADRELRQEAERGNVELSWKYPLYYGGFRLWEVAQSLRRSDLTLFSNRSDLEYAVEHLNVSRTKATVVSNGIPVSFRNLPLESLAERGSQPIRIAQIGTYIPRKGVEYGARALNRLLRRHSSVTVTFLGTQVPAEDVLDDFAPDVREQITVVPQFQREHLPRLVAHHQIKLFPTKFEGFSVALVEAMACGLAPVTTATPGPMEIVRNGVNGILVPPRDSEALESALELLVGDPTLLDRLRRAAHKTAQSYSWEQIARDTLTLYREAAAKKWAHAPL
jgi:glycosyltransferase involved in cell wall biosynthesis